MKFTDEHIKQIALKAGVDVEIVRRAITALREWERSKKDERRAKREAMTRRRTERDGGHK